MSEASNTTDSSIDDLRIVYIDMSEASERSATLLSRIIPPKLQKKMAYFYFGVFQIAMVAILGYMIYTKDRGWLVMAILVVFALPLLVIVVFYIVPSILLGTDTMVRNWRKWPKGSPYVEAYGVSVRTLMREVDQFRCDMIQQFGEPSRQLVAWGCRFLALTIPAILYLAWLRFDAFALDREHSQGFAMLAGIISLILFSTLLMKARNLSRRRLRYDEKVPFAFPIQLATAACPLVLWVICVFVIQRAGFNDPMVGLWAFLGVLTLSMWLLVLVLKMTWGENLSAESLLQKYSGTQITLLRSFADDAIVIEARDPLLLGHKFHDFPLETELGDVLKDYGSFVAIGSDKEQWLTVAGRARRLESDDADWQAVALRWIENSVMTVMIVGGTDWLKWELRQVIEHKRTNRLLMFFPPEYMGHWGEIAGGSIKERWVAMTECFVDTLWYESMRAVDIRNAVAAHFAPEGTVVMIRKKDARDYDYALSLPFSMYGMFCHDWNGTGRSVRHGSPAGSSR